MSGTVRVLFDINHPAHAHFFKYAILDLMKRNSFSIHVTSTTKEVNEQILEAYSIRYKNLGYYRSGLIKKFIDFILVAIRFLREVRRLQPDIVISMSSARPFAGLVSNAKTYIFDDTEHAWEQIALYKPFANKIITPDCFTKDLGPKQVRFAGYKELAYLHPCRYSPNSSILKEIDLNENDVFFVVRFVAWNATHDIGHKGISHLNKKKLIEKLKSYGRVIIIAEDVLPAIFEPYRINVCPSKTHDLLYYASMFVGEGATMASECAVLGTPAIYINSLNLGYIQEQADRGLLYSLREDSKLLEVVEYCLSHKLCKKEEHRRHALLAIKDKIDVTGYIIELIEWFSMSLKKSK